MEKQFKIVCLVALAVLAAGCLVSPGGDRNPAAPIQKSEVQNKADLSRLVSVNYTSREGLPLTSRYAYQGLVVLLVSENVTDTDVRNTVAALGGKIFDAMPSAGIYTIEVPQDRVALVISGLLEKPFVIDAAPASPVTEAGIILFDYFNRTGGEDPRCGIHGINVASIARGVDGLPVEMVELDTPDYIGRMYPLAGQAFVGNWYPALAQKINSRMEQASRSGEHVIIGLSLQSIASGMGTKYTCSNPAEAGALDCRIIRQEQMVFLEQLFQTIQRAPPAARQKAAIVVAAGNAGVNMTDQIISLNRQYPNAAKSIRIVGATDEQDHIDTSMNYASTGIVYAQGVNVLTDAGGTCSGTSFAAPAVENILELMWNATPNLTSAQLNEAFDDALKTCAFAAPSGNIVPFTSAGTVRWPFVDCAINKAKAKAGIPASPAPTPAPTKTVQVPNVTLTTIWAGNSNDDEIGWDPEGRGVCMPIQGGGHFQCVSKYPSGTIVWLAALPHEGADFLGWSGACSGTGICTITMDKDKTVTARFELTGTPTPTPDYYTYCNENYPGSTYDPSTESCRYHVSVTPTTRTAGAGGPTLIPLDGACCPGENCRTQVADATGGSPPYHFSSGSFAGGAPPMGMIVDLNGYLTGVAQAEGTFTFSVCVADITGATDCRQSRVIVS